MKILTSRKSDEWCTPPSLVAELKTRGYDILIDLACTKENGLPGTQHCFNMGKNALESFKTSLVYPHQVAFCHPPDSQVGWFVRLIHESEIPCILLLPARTGTLWFHRYIYNQPPVQVEFIKGRLRFSGSRHNAPFPSILVFMNTIYIHQNDQGGSDAV